MKNRDQVTDLELLSIVFGSLLLLLLALLFWVSIYYRKEIIRSLWSGFIELIRPKFETSFILFFPVWAIVKTIDWAFTLNIFRSTEEDLSEEPYKSNKNVHFNFLKGEKAVLIKGDASHIKASLDGFIDDFNLARNDNDFLIKNESDCIALHCSTRIPFETFCYLVQYFDNVMRIKQPTGIFISEDMSFFIYQDKNTTHNLVGRTTLGETFSIYTLDDLNENTHLRMNSEIAVVDRVSQYNLIRKCFEMRMSIEK